MDHAICPGGKRIILLAEDRLVYQLFARLFICHLHYSGHALYNARRGRYKANVYLPKKIGKRDNWVNCVRSTLSF